MADEQTVGENKTSRERPKVKRTKRPKISRPPSAREQSTIQFPYMDLETAMSVAGAILRGGGVAVSRDQLAGLMNQSASGGNFVQKVAAARLFGMISFNGGKYELTDLGFNILDSDETRQKTARKEAFLGVQLFRKTYDEFRNKQLPPRPHGLEQAFIKFGVVPNQKTNARLAFDKSALQAGFFAAGQDRLVEPIIGGSSSTERSRIVVDEIDLTDEDHPPATVKGKPNLSGLHPFIQGLLDTLPEPATNWTIEGRAKWLQAAANIFDLIYKGSGQIDITAKPDPSSAEKG
jgi:hypothetical protein